MHICKCTKSSLLKHQCMFPFPWLGQESDLKRHLWVWGIICIEWETPCRLFPSSTAGPTVCLSQVSWEQCLPPGPQPLHPCVSFLRLDQGWLFTITPEISAAGCQTTWSFFFRNADPPCLWFIVSRIAIKSGVSTKLKSSWRAVDGFHRLGG